MVVGRNPPASPMPPVPANAPPRNATALSQRTARDHRVVVTLLLIAVLAVLVLAGITVRATVRRDAVRQRVGGTMTRASLVQLEFHTRHRRFALWDELAERGMRLPSALEVEASTATPSHWYLRVRDVNSGLVCDRIGLLTDPPGQPMLPSCKPVP
jgi:hypothetical protein